MWGRIVWASLTAIGLVSSPSWAQTDEARLRVVDVGAGLCVVASFPGHHHLLYDAGHWQSTTCRQAVRDLVGDDRIELVVISHGDADHLGELPEILTDKRASIVLHPGGQRDSGAWRDAFSAVGDEVLNGVTVLSLQTWPLQPGTTFALGDARVEFIFGLSTWNDALSDPGARPSPAERHNAISITVRIVYGGHSLLLTGDAIGRRLQDPDGACRDAERFMVENQAAAGLRSDVLVAAHHGGDNGSAACFIEAVQPQWVIFSAGHSHGHPTQGAAERFLAAGLTLDRMFRTDRGDDEGPGEWPFGRRDGCTDRRGDDDVELVMRPGAPLEVGYMRPDGGC